MSAPALFVLLIVAGAGLAVSGICALVLFLRKRRQGFLLSLAAAGVCGILCATSGITLGGRAVRGVFRSVAEAQEGRKRHLDHVETLKSYVTPGTTVPEAFYTDPGLLDFYRFPLVWPYELTMIDAPDEGFLGTFAPGTSTRPIESQIIRLCHDGRFLLAQRSPDPRPQSEHSLPWILFEFSTRAVSRFPTEEALKKEAVRRGYAGDLKLRTIREHIGEFF